MSTPLLRQKLGLPVDKENSGDSKKASAIHSNSDSKESLIIYDWDDTILPTTWLRSLGYLSNNISDMIGTPPPSLPMHIASMMGYIEESAIENFRAAMLLGRVIIITNSSTQWVPFTAKRFFPRLSQIVDSSGFEVYSARPSQVESSGPNYVYLPSMAVTWKTDKFREMLALGKCLKTGGSSLVNYSTCVSIGDGFAERCAVLAVANRSMPGKAVRIPLQPTGSLLLEQLKLTCISLPHIIKESRTGDIYLNSTIPGSYRLIPVHISADNVLSNSDNVILAAQKGSYLDEPAIISDDDDEYEESNEAAEMNTGGGLIQAITTGIVNYGKSISHSVTALSNSNDKHKSERKSTTKAQQEPHKVLGEENSWSNR